MVTGITGKDDEEGNEKKRRDCSTGPRVPLTGSGVLGQEDG